MIHKSGFRELDNITSCSSSAGRQGIASCLMCHVILSNNVLGSSIEIRHTAGVQGAGGDM